MDRSSSAEAPAGAGTARIEPVDAPADDRDRRWVAVAVPAALGLVAAALVVAASRDGLGTTPDGVSYLGAATNLADGRGLTGPFATMVDPFTPRQAVAFDGAVPFIQWPPLYPFVLGIGAWLGVDPITVARAVSVLALAGTVAGVARVTERLAPRAWVPAAVAAAWVLVSPYVALLHVLVASEHLFLVLVLTGLWAGARWSADAPWRDGPAWPWGAVAVVAGSAATLTRFAGVAVVAALAVGVLVAGRGDRRHRWGLAGGVVAVGVVPALAWSQLTARQAGVPTRTLAWHPPDRAQWEGVGDTLAGWFAPTDAPTALRTLVVLAALAAVALAVAGWRRALADRSGAVPAEARPWLVLVVAFTVTYLIAVLVTHSLFDRAVPISQRLLVPLQPPLAVTVAGGVAWWWRRVAPTWAAPARTGTVVALVAAAALGLAGLRSSWWPLVEPGRPWPADPATTEVAKLLADQPGGAVLAANDPALVWASTDRAAIALPVRTYAPSGRDNPRFDAQLDELADVLGCDGVAVVYSSSALLNPHVAGVGDLVGSGLTVVATFDDATVLGVEAGDGCAGSGAAGAATDG